MLTYLIGCIVSFIFTILVIKNYNTSIYKYQKLDSDAWSFIAVSALFSYLGIIFLICVILMANK